MRHRHFDKLSANGLLNASIPFRLSLSKPVEMHLRRFDKISANGLLNASIPFGLSLSKPWCHTHTSTGSVRTGAFQ